MSIAIVASALANKPGNGGNAWVASSYVAGLRRLGFETLLVEQIDPVTCVDDHGKPVDFLDSWNLAFFIEAVGQLGATDHSVLICGGERWGTKAGRIAELVAEADLLLNISGHLTDALHELPKRKVYVDLDPGYTQFWQQQGTGGSRLDGHDVYVTVGSNIGGPGCSIPTNGIPWITTLPPTVLPEWPVVDVPEEHRFTTVASWRGPFGPVVDGDRALGPKAHQFRKFAALPERAPASFEIALEIHPGDARDVEMLRGHGWHVVDPVDAAGGLEDFRRYVQGSFAEFSVAQGMYVDTRSGWFSDRTARYLATGRPAVVQDTGIGRLLPVGEGLLTFRTLGEAVAGVRAVLDDPERHAKAARALAEEYLDSDVVLGRLVEQVGVAP